MVVLSCVSEELRGAHIERSICMQISRHESPACLYQVPIGLFTSHRAELSSSAARKNVIESEVYQRIRRIAYTPRCLFATR